MTSNVCGYVDMALSLQQAIRERTDGGDTATRIGEACGEPSVGSVDHVDGSRRYFCALHPLEPRIVRD